MVNGTYRADFWASDSEGTTDTDSVIFTVAIPDEPVPTPTPTLPPSDTLGSPWFIVTVTLVVIGGAGSGVWIYRSQTKTRSKVVEP